MKEFAASPSRLVALVLAGAVLVCPVSAADSASITEIKLAYEGGTQPLTTTQVVGTPADLGVSARFGGQCAYSCCVIVTFSQLVRGGEGPGSRSPRSSSRASWQSSSDSPSSLTRSPARWQPSADRWPATSATRRFALPSTFQDRLGGHWCTPSALVLKNDKRAKAEKPSTGKFHGQPSFCASRSPTIAGLALPLESFITWPLRKLSAAALPAR